MHFSHLGSRSRIWCTIGRATCLAIIIIESIKIQLKTVGFHKICWYSVEKLSIDLAIHAYPAPSDKEKKKKKIKASIICPNTEILTICRQG